MYSTHDFAHNSESAMCFVLTMHMNSILLQVVVYFKSLAMLRLRNTASMYYCYSVLVPVGN